jgi:carbonic anhydrase
MIPASDALRRLQDGNQRYVAGRLKKVAEPSQDQRRELAGGQTPFAVVLGCSDSRVPVETVFDQGLGDLFVVRVAGNIVASSQVGSVEFAAQVFGTRLVVVLGHSNCGAVKATLDGLRAAGERPSPGLHSIVARIEPVVAPLLAAGETEGEELVDAAVKANVHASVDELIRQSEILQQLAAEDGLVVVGAEYSLDSGEVEFFGAA